MKTITLAAIIATAIVWHGSSNVAGTARSPSRGTVANGLSSNGLSFNGLSFNGLSFNGLSFNGNDARRTGATVTGIVLRDGRLIALR